MSGTLKTTQARSCGGYTLIESAVVLMVSSLLIVSFISAYDIYKKNQIRQTTELNASMVTSALSNFLIQKGRYPCPSRINAQRTDADYGIESQCDPNPATQDATLGAYPAAVPGTFVNGLWYETSLTQVDSDPGPGVVPVTPKIRRGGIPFRSLGLPEDMSEDGYGDRFQYAITEPLAVTQTYHRGNSGIAVYNASNTPYFKAGTGNGAVSLHPDSDISSSFITVSGAGTKWSKIFEASATPADLSTALTAGTYVYGQSGKASDMEVGLGNPVTTPGVGTVNVNYTAIKLKSGPAADSSTSATKLASIHVYVKDGGVQIKDCGAVDLNNGTDLKWHTFNCQFASTLVTDWNTLSLRFHQDTTTTTRFFGLGWAEMQVPASTAGYVDYFVFSSGKDRAGAYSRYGQLINPCPTGQLDTQNCDTTTQAIYRIAEYSEASGAAAANHFDDFAKFNVSVETPLWRLTGASGAHIRDLLGVETTGGKVAIGQDPDPSNAAVLQVGGAAGVVRANNANAMVSEVCDPQLQNCFSPEKIGTADADFKCSAANGGAYAIGFEDGKIKCSDVQQVGCQYGQFMTGVLPSGQPECVSVVGCPAKNITLCNTAYALPSGVQGQVFTTPTFGYNYQETWTCGPNPQWSPTGQTGICNCAPVDEVYDLPCNSVRSGNWTGVTTFHHVHACPANTDTTTQTGNTCACVDTTETQTDFNGCGFGFTGSITRQRTWSCTSGTAGAWSSWTVPPGGNTCVCNAQAPQTQTLQCPTAYTGTHIQQRDFQCPAGTWSAWYDTTNTCTCNDGQVQTGSASCPAGYGGSATSSRTYSCATNSWGPWVIDTSGCTCTPTTETQTLSCQTAYTGSIVQHRDFTCPSATWGSWVTDSNTCTCTGATQNQTVGCTAPLVGTKDQQRSYNCGSGTWGPWTDTVDNCISVTYTWVPKTTGQSGYGSGLTYHSGASCPTVGEKQPCSALDGGGNGYIHYSECQCE